MIKALRFSLFLAIGLAACEASTSDFAFLSDEEYVENFKVCEVDTDCMMTRSFCLLPESISKSQEYAFIEHSRTFVEEMYRMRKKRSPQCKISEYVDITALRPVCEAKVCSYATVTPLN